ncbi:class A beta-lactamase [Cryobacterium suzukii]|uniref:Beta-lactamase n=1 Tax=Cryobacterium suzukii TaxID=1259198 RepID=A0A4V3ISV5_9MICO|nr:class A beta-lactamase [Cryobacterium suzukii]TFD62234.1 class A beta-lactamase [Cryobacterium suzukii]
MARPTSLRKTSAIATATVFAFLLSGCAPATSPRAVPSPAASTQTAKSSANADAKFTNLEAAHDARLGVYAVDTGTGEEVVWRSDERFAFASTSKALSAAALLDSVGIAGLSADVDVAAEDIVSSSPQTQQHVGASMTLGELAAASVQHSDNTAANLVVEHLGGPAGFDSALSRIGDDTTEATRTEPSLNEWVPGDRRDTTTPRALTMDLRTYVLGDVLSGEERELLTTWLIDHSLGDTLVRAGTPQGWTVGDKSGAAAYGTRNDIAVIWPPSGSPIVIAVMSSRTEADAEYDDALVAAAASAAVALLDKRS